VIYEPASRSASAAIARGRGAAASLQRLGELVAVASPRVPVEHAAAFRGANRPEELAALGASAASRAPDGAAGVGRRDG
jgi:hypothetical protein